MSERILAIRNLEEIGYNTQFVGYAVETTDQIITLKIDNHRKCCEQWGWFWSNDNPQDFVGTDLLEVSITDTALNTKKIEDNGADSRNEGKILFVNLSTTAGVLQFVAYNSHNGWYGHSAIVESKQLEHSVSL